MDLWGRASGCFKDTLKNNLAKDGSDMTISIIYDNNQYDKLCKAGWGFSSLISLGDRNVLFDTGAEGRILLHNMEKMKIDPQTIDGIFLSHQHWDHTGGLADLLKTNEKAGLILLKSFSKDFIDELELSGRKITQIDNPTDIFQDVYSTGPLGEIIDEHSLVARTEKGLVVIAGCAHPGVTKIAEKAQEIFDQKIFLLLGGFHLLEKKDGEIKSIINQLRDLEVQKVAPCHCTGYAGIDMLKKEYKKDFVEIGAGRLISFEE
jgi:7,8-dihydropterin-6-yl-methyl-4-(beta-D-ribofuranosyl)aminobenzene 5'-phosphate synthase